MRCISAKGTKRKSNKIFYNLYWGLGDPIIEVRNERLEVRKDVEKALLLRGC